MKKVFLFLVLACLPFGFLFSQASKDKKAGFQLSFIPPLSTQGMLAPEYTNSVSFNILAGVSKNVTVFSLSSLGNYVVNDLEGFHLSGLGTYAGSNGNGVMISGLFNRTKEFRGTQLSGLLNITDNTTGFQLGGLSNIANGNMRGFQFSSLMNMAEDLNGFQFAGLINIAKDVKGVQLGVVNFADSNDYPVGIVNIVRKNGEMSLGIAYNEIGSMMLSFRSGGRVLYGILGVGFNHKLDKETFIVEAGFGGRIPISSRFRINNELKAANTAFGSENTVHSSFNIMPAFKIFPQWEIFAGPSLNYLYTDQVENKKMFPDHSLWKKYGDKKLQQLYIGYTAGIHYIF